VIAKKFTKAKLGLLLLGWLALFNVGSSDSARVLFAQERVPSTDALESARARWSTLPAEERERMRKRFERVQKMDTVQRKELEKRTARLLKMQKRVVDHLSKSDRKRLMSQPLERRRELVAELVEQERRDQGQRIESKLPTRIRNWLREASPSDRRERLGIFRREVRERISALAVEDLARTLGYTEAERKRLERLSLPKRLQTVLSLRKQLTAQQISASGLPSNFSAERWKEIEKLPPEKFVAEVMRLQNSGALGDLREFGTSARETGNQPKAHLARAFRQAMRLTASDRLSLSDLSHREKRARLNQKRRRQVADMLGRLRVAKPEELKSMEQLTNEEFIQRARELTEVEPRTKPKRRADSR
jgi:hypothetical protein